LRLIGRLFTGFALLAGYVVAACAQAPTCTGKNILDELRTTDPPVHSAILAAAARTENANAIFWRVEKAGTAPSHLFGTVHLTDERVHRLSPAVQAALTGARRLVLELDDLSPDAMAQQIAKSPQLAGLMMFTDGRRLDQLLGGTDFATLSQALSRSGVPSQAVGVFRPWMVTLMLAISECEQHRMKSGLLSLDARLAKETEKRGLKALGLETVASQLTAMAAVPEPDQVEVLKSTVRYYHRVDDFIETMVQLYQRRELGALWPLQLALAEKVGVARQAFDSYERALLTTRNLGMRDAAVPHLAEGRAFIAVGALHLPGKNGLVSLLRGAGYVVTALE
jgi:uncharacterized protein YbaP (TraB family)